MHLRRNFRIEWCVDRCEVCSHLRQHGFQHVVAADAQTILNNLQVGMSVPDMPSDPEHVGGAPTRNFNQRLRRASDFNNAAIVEHESIAVAQSDWPLQVEQKGGSFFSRQYDAPALAIIGIKNNAINRVTRAPRTNRFDRD
jgi:hypothetical protein